MKLKRPTKKQSFVVLVLLIIAAAITAFFVLRSKTDESSETPEPQIFYSKLTGLEVSKEISERPLLGIMVENSVQARPQSGLDSAEMVFEAVTEGGITRFLLLFEGDAPETVGPVRSLRTHFLNWLMGFDASVAHVGGSPDALRLANDRDARSLSEFTYQEPYFRSSERESPHNMYVRTAELRALMDSLDHNKSSFSPIPFTDGTAVDEPDATKVVIDFSSPNYRAEFRFDPATNRYARFQAGQPHIDAFSGEQITVSNVVAIRTNGQNSLGDGRAVVFKNGTSQEVEWSQASYDDRIKMLDTEGNEVPLNRGDTWIVMLANERNLSY